MKTFFLLLSYLILGLGIWFLTTLNLLHLAFNYEDLLFYLAIAGFVSVVVLIISTSLNKKFNLEIEKFIKGSSDQLIINKKLLGVYGKAIILMLPLLIYLLLLALFAAVSFSLYGFIIISNAERVPVALIFGLAVVALGTAYSVLIGLHKLFFPPKLASFGINLDEKKDLTLWNLVNTTAKAVNTKPANEIIISPDPGIGVYNQGNLISLLFGGGKRILEIGLPSIYGLSVAEFQAILAHEYGHFSNKDTIWGNFTSIMTRSILVTYRAVPGPTQSGEERKNSIYELILALNPAYWIIHLFIKIYYRLINGFSRVQEVKADICAMQLYGGKNFGEGLLNVTVNDRLFNDVVIDKYVPMFLKENKVISNFSKIIEHVYKNVGKKTLKNMREEISHIKDSNVYSTHPSLDVRLRYAQKFKNPNASKTNSIKSLFDSWDNLSEEVTNLFNYRLQHYLSRATSQDKSSVDSANK